MIIIKIRIRIRIKIKIRIEIKIKIILINIIKETDTHFYKIKRELYVLIYYPH
jgi:hypothetical protein